MIERLNDGSATRKQTRTTNNNVKEVAFFSHRIGIETSSLYWHPVFIQKESYDITIESVSYITPSLVLYADFEHVIIYSSVVVELNVEKKMI